MLISGTDCVGGLVGSSWGPGEISSSYSSGSVSATGNDVGGLVGDGSAEFATHSVWDVETSGQTRSDGGAGLTTAEMMDPEMLGLNGFANDPNWVLDPGQDYPHLAWEGTPGNMIPEPEIDWLEGEGTPDNPYRIDTTDQLILLGKASILWNRHFVMGADIELDPALPGRRIFGQAVIRVFTGVFDGDGHTISNLTIAGNRELGLFGRLAAEAEVRSVGVVDVYIVGSGSCLGGLAGLNVKGSIDNCHSSGSVSGTGNLVGGIVGSNWGSIVSSYSIVSVIHIGFLSTIKILSPDRNIRASQNPAAFRFSSAAAVCFAA